MTIFTNRELERVASLRMNWRKEFLLEVVRTSQISQDPGIACHRRKRPIFDLPPITEAQLRAPGPMIGTRLIS
jgi:hypothetical protein